MAFSHFSDPDRDGTDRALPDEHTRRRLAVLQEQHAAAIARAGWPGDDGLHESTDRISTGFRPRRKGGRIRAVWAIRRVRLAARRGVEGRSVRRTARKTLCARTNILISYSRAK